MKNMENIEKKATEWLLEVVSVPAANFHSRFHRDYDRVPRWRAMRTPSHSEAVLVVGAGTGAKKRVAEYLAVVAELSQKYREAARTEDERIAREAEAAATAKKAEHELQVKKNRTAGAKKAAETRRYNAAHPHVAARVYVGEKDCPACDGYGLVYVHGHDEKCKRCSGRGTVARYETLRFATAEEAAEAAARKRETWDGTLTSTWENQGLIDHDEAETIREKTRKRHEETNYDELLAAGCSREDARALMEKK